LGAAHILLYCNAFRSSKVKQVERDVVFARFEVGAATQAEASQELSCSQILADTVAASEVSHVIFGSQSATVNTRDTC